MKSTDTLASHILSPGTELTHNYIIDKILGEGGFGITYSGTMKLTGEKVAIKEYFPNGLAHRERNAKNEPYIVPFYGMEDAFQKGLQHFINEASILKEFHNLNSIVSVKDVLETNGTVYLVMEFIDGIPINHHTELEAHGYSREVLAERLTNAVFHQIIIEGFFHGDPHPGNVSVLEDETIALMDFGMVGRLSQDMKYNFGTLLIGMMRKDASGVVKAIVKMGVVPTGVEMNVLNRDAEKLRDKYYDIPLSYLNIGEAVQDIFQIANKHRIGLPQDFTILGKSIITLESVVSSLDPDFSIMDVAEPFGRLLVKEKYDPRNVASRAYNNLQDVSDTAVDVSNNLKIFSDSLREKKVPVQLSLRRFEELFRRMDRIGNRLSFSIVLLSFSIIMVGLIVGAAIAGQTTVIWQIPAIEIGFVLAVFLFLGLL